MPKYILNAEGNFFLQEEVSLPFEWLTCTGVGDIAVPLGAKTPVYCLNPMDSGQIAIEGFIHGDPGFGTYTLEKPLASVYNALLALDCEFQGRINWTCRGSRMDPLNFEVAALLVRSSLNSHGITNPVRTPEGSNARVLTNGSVDFIQMLVIYHLMISAHTLANTADALGVFFLPRRCEDRCGPARALCSYGIIGCENPQYPAYLYDSEIKKTFDGSTWTATATDPYAYGGDTRAVYIFERVDGTRYVVFRHTGVLGHPAECSYSEDEGDTWTSREIGTVNEQFVNAVAICAAKIVAACSGGYLYESYDQGSNWVARTAGTLTTEDLNDIWFHDDRQGYSVGNDNEFLYTSDGGMAYYAGTGPAVGVNLLSVTTNLKGHVFITTDDGRVFVSENEGDTWALRTNLTAGTIPWIRFDPKAHFVGYFIHNTAGGVGELYRSLDGGATWFAEADMPDNNGLNWGHICDENTVVVVGNIDDGGNTFVASTAPTS